MVDNISISPMDTYTVPPNILSLTGIKLTDHTDWVDERNKTLYAQAIVYDQQTESNQCFSSPAYDEKPSNFVFSSEALFHIRTLSINCWECCGLSGIKGDNVFIPKIPQIQNKNYTASVEGIFCSFPCAERWIETFYMAGQLQAAQENLCILFYLYTGFRVSMIKPSPLRTRHHQFGGSMTTKMYTEAVKELNPLNEILSKNKSAVADTLQVRIDKVCGNSICRMKNVQHQQQMCWQKQNPKAQANADKLSIIDSPPSVVAPPSMVAPPSVVAPPPQSVLRIEYSELLALFFN